MKKASYILAFLALSSCGKSDFIHELQGKWQVTEINYISDYDTTTYIPSSEYFVFDGWGYQHWNTDTLNEAGTFNVNPKVTLITFYSSLGHYGYNILEQSDANQHWRSKSKIIDFYLDFKLEKVQ